MQLVKLLLLALLLAVPCTDGVTATPDDTEVNEAHIEEAHEEFRGIDTNGDGFLTRAEIMAVEEVPEEEQIDEFFETYDQNKDGKACAPRITACAGLIGSASCVAQVSFDEILESDGKMRHEEEMEAYREGQAEL